MMKDFDSCNYLEIKGMEVGCKYVHVGRLVNQMEVVGEGPLVQPRGYFTNLGGKTIYGCSKMGE
jgi:hypothetical protein